jgi:hypothetical protein
MDNPVNPVPVTLTIPGLCRWLPVSPSPLAMEPGMENGVPVIEVTLGLTAGGKPVTVRVTSLDYLDALEYHVRAARTRLVMFNQDHSIHPFGDDSDFLAVAEAAGVTGAAA